MIVLITLSVVMVIAMCALAYMLATYAVPFFFAVMTTRFAFATGAGYIGAGIVGLFAGAASYGFLAYLYATLRSPGLRLAIALIFAVPAAIAGFALVHGFAREAVPSEVWRKIFSLIGGAFVGLSALARLREGP
ncbi:hypothetical protein [Agrobacterium vitis]|uniref:Uncharacterized protein n=1 Tax=Agrobacterium vitis TaxID=373 RepID=A0AAE2UTV3_AGRVI|nr:hypothetical protein [Agrobacterium vitis]MBF2717708.1 hypothetical protein [Agrobacterium vitis]MVA22725.1 hypothetical protein [Agrobacterium vitis]